MKTNFFDIASALRLARRAIFSVPLLGEYEDATQTRPLG